jgi:hypothetical protein
MALGLFAGAMMTGELRTKSLLRVVHLHGVGGGEEIGPRALLQLGAQGGGSGEVEGDGGAGVDRLDGALHLIKGVGEGGGGEDGEVAPDRRCRCGGRGTRDEGVGRAGDAPGGGARRARGRGCGSCRCGGARSVGWRTGGGRIAATRGKQGDHEQQRRREVQRRAAHRVSILFDSRLGTPACPPGICCGCYELPTIHTWASRTVWPVWELS